MDAFFKQALASADDIAARLLAGEWLDERGDGKGDGYRWMAERDRRPFNWNGFAEIPGYSTFDWYGGTGAVWEVPTYCTLPVDVWAALDPRRIDTQCWSAYRTVRAAEDALCRVIEALSVGRLPTWSRRRRRRRHSDSPPT